MFGAQFGGATIAFLWPNLKGGFGSLVAAGNIDDIKAEISDAGVRLQRHGPLLRRGVLGLGDR